MNKTILITGNHHTPAIELIKQLQEDNISWTIHYVAHIYPSETHLLHTIIPKLKVNFHNLESGKFDRRWLPNTIRGIPKTLKALFTALRLIRSINPAIIVSFGGYTSVPVIVAGRLFGYPSITHEQTLTPSLATRINAYFTTRIALSFKDTIHLNRLPLSKITVTGNLLRSDINSNQNSSFKTLARTIDRYPLIYITGGNQGSQIINSCLLKTLKKLTSSYTVLHQTGKPQYSAILAKTKKLKRYLAAEYVGLEDIGWVLRNTSLIISRSGANICQEIVALKKNSILIPLPYSQQNEQLINAAWVKKQLPSQTEIINESELTPSKLLDSIKLLGTKSIQTQTKLVRNYRLLKLIHELV